MTDFYYLKFLFLRKSCGSNKLSSYKIKKKSSNSFYSALQYHYQMKSTILLENIIALLTTTINSLNFGKVT